MEGDFIVFTKWYKILSAFSVGVHTAFVSSLRVKANFKSLSKGIYQNKNNNNET